MGMPIMGMIGICPVERAGSNAPRSHLAAPLAGTAQARPNSSPAVYFGATPPDPVWS